MTEQEFNDPGREYRGVTLWMLNDRLEPEGIARQTAGFREAGWGALIARTFTGLRTEYLSPAWHDSVRNIISEAAKNGLKTWLQAGYMPSAVPDLPEDEQHRVLVRRGDGNPPAAGETVLLERDGVLYCEGRVSSVIDLLDDEACRKYLERAYTNTLEPQFGHEFGTTVEAIWVDEPHLQPPALTWSRRFPEQFERDWGYPIVEHIPSLFTREGDWRKVRHHYWRTVLRLLLESYFSRIGGWCTERNLKFSGHLMGEDTIRSQISWTAACMPGYEYMHLPGIDHLTKSLEWPANLPFVLPPLQCASAAHQLGRREILSEIYAVSSEGLSFADRKRIGDWMMILGINYRCYHGSFYSIRGRRKRFYVPHLSHQQPWWEDNAAAASYFARFSYIMRQGEFDAEILLLHPVESGFCLYDPTKLAPENVHNRADEPEDIRRLNDGFQAAAELLLDLNRGFDLGDETLIARHGAVERGRLRVGKMRYRAVVLPPLITIRASTLQLLTRFLDEGGTVIATGDLPDRIDGAADARAEAFARRVTRAAPEPGALDAALEPAAPRPFTLKVLTPDRTVGGIRPEDTAASGGSAGSAPAGGSPTAGGPADGESAPASDLPAASGKPARVWVHRRIEDENRIMAILNTEQDRAAQVELTLHESGHLEDWDLSTGSVTDAPYERGEGSVTVRTELPPGASKLYVLKTGAPAREAAPAVRLVPSRKIAVEGPWLPKRLSPNALTLDFCAFRRGNSPWSDPLPIQAVQEILSEEGYRGRISLRFTFEADEPPRSLFLVLEDPREYLEIVVNGMPVSYEDLPPYLDEPLKPIEISRLVAPGVNAVELTREFVPLSKPKFHLATLFHTAVGVELEAVYLTGAFALAPSPAAGPQVPGCRRLGHRFALRAEPKCIYGDLVTEGYPFFAGRFAIERTAELPAPREGERVFLTFPAVLAALLKARVNGAEAGTIAWAPYETEITALVREGANRIELELVSGLRNLIGPHHRPDGEPSQTWADGWTGFSTAERRETKLIAGHDWYAHRTDGTVYWTDDYLFLPFGAAPGTAVEYRRPE